MREDIKKRIEFIEAAKVPNGYKSTIVGIIPDDWSVSNLTSFLLEKKELSNDITKYPLYSSSRKGLLRQSEYYVNKEAVETNLGYKIVPNGFVTYRHMSDDDIFFLNINNTGLEILVSSEYPVFTTQNMSLIFLIEHLNNMPRFRYFCRAQKMGGTRTRLYFSSLKKYKMPMPQLDEQQKIAKILNHCDKVIKLKQQLIEEEKNRKFGFIHSLLNPNSGTRLVGFTKKWKKCKIKSVATVVSGGTPLTNNSEYWNGSIFWCTPTDISNSGKYISYTKQTITESGINNSSATLLPKGAVLMCSRATIGTKAIAATPISTNQGFKSFICSKSLNNEFFYYLLDYILDSLMPLASGNTFRELSKSSVANFEIEIPGIDEQIAISDILSAQDRLIDHLEQELTQWQQKKKSLMQLLLTGIVRVPV